MNSSKLVSCGLSHHVQFPPFNRCRLLIFCLPNKSCMFIHVYYSQIFSKNICQTEGCILLCSLSLNTNNPTAQNIHNIIAFIPITKLPGILVSKEFQILFAKGITSMPCRKSCFVVGPSALNCPMYLPGPRDFPGCSF